MVAQTQPPQMPTRWPLAVMPENRDSSTAKDAKIINGYLEKTEQGYEVYKRAGYGEALGLSVSAGAGLGMFNWNGDLYYVTGTTLYKNGVSLGTVANASGDPYFFNSCLGAVPKLALGNGAAAYHYEPVGGLLPMGGVAPPVASVYGFAYVDGGMYYLNTASFLQGSGFNDLDTWDTLNVIRAQMEPSQGVAAMKHLAYVLAMKWWTTEVFYDAGTVPCALAPVQGAQLQFGCRSARTVQEIDGKLFWLASTTGAGLCVVQLQDLKISVISTRAIERLVQGAGVSHNLGWSCEFAGHRFYVLTCQDLNITLAYDLQEKTWAQWVDVNGNYMPIAASATLGTACLLQHLTNGKIYTMVDTAYTDAGDLITFDLYTPNFDAGVDRRKTLKMLRINADQQNGSVLQIRCNDYDYDANKWTNFRTLNLGQKRPFLTDCGTFRIRAYHFRHQCNAPLRIRSADLHLELGTL